MKSYEVHPAADLFPLMSDDELQGLVADIKENGQLEPVTFWNGKLVDGRNRANACKQLGIDVDACELDPEVTKDPLAWVVSHNLHRRHLSNGQKSQVALKLKKLLEPGAAEAKRDGGKQAGNGRPKKDGAKLPQPKTKRKPRTRDKAAAMLGVSGKLVDAAEKVEKKGTPELNAAVASGKVSVTRAAKIADAPKEEQAALIDEPRKKPAERSVFTDLRRVFDAMTAGERKTAALMWEGWLDE
jgi:ParB-like chromosome segregation protein Spo0J